MRKLTSSDVIAIVLGETATGAERVPASPLTRTRAHATRACSRALAAERVRGEVLRGRPSVARSFVLDAADVTRARSSAQHLYVVESVDRSADVGCAIAIARGVCVACRHVTRAGGGFLSLGVSVARFRRRRRRRLARARVFLCVCRAAGSDSGRRQRAPSIQPPFCLLVSERDVDHTHSLQLRFYFEKGFLWVTHNVMSKYLVLWVTQNIM